MRDLLARAAVTLVRRSFRNALTLIAIVLSATTITALFGITAGSSAQTAERFSQLDSPIIQATLPATEWENSENDILQRLVGFTNITRAGTLDLPQDTASSLTVTAPRWGTSIKTNIAVATAQGLMARQASITSGSYPVSESVSARDPYTVSLGSRLASELGVTASVNQGLSARVSLNGTEMAVTGILQDAENQSELSTAVVVTPQTAALLGLLPPNRTLQIRVTENAASTVGSLLGLALHPQDAEAVPLKYPASPEKLRASLMQDSQNLTLIICVIMAIVSAFSIINTMQIAVTERRREIGISLALGLSGKDISIQFLLESMLLGTLGGFIGMLIGSVIVAGASLLLFWPYILPQEVLLIPVAGIIIGALAGLIPAIRAARIDPVELLRST
ncbi:MAG: ABC transporter permease [Bifidobacteriaceae bacterium]|jgi:putative ABC transport system permease protein|nr:ABC transporter permease [Bifidobacteriaceae bacterium]